MLQDELGRRLKDLEAQIEKLDEDIAPLLSQLRRLQDYRQSVLKLLELEVGTAGESVNYADTEAVVPRKPSGDPHWKAMCDERGWLVNGDSAHRVVIRRDPALHSRIGHYCDYDGRSYPKVAVSSGSEDHA